MNKKNKIAIITAGETPIPAVCGGATETMMTHVLDVNEEKKKIDFVVFNYKNEKAEKVGKKYKEVKFIYYDKSIYDEVSLLFWRGLRKLTRGRTYLRSNYIKFCIRHLENIQPDIVLVEGNHFQVLQLSKHISNDIILHMHIDGLNKDTDNGKKIIESCKGIITISNHCYSRVVEVEPEQKNKIFILRNTVDLEHFNDNHENFRRAFRKENKISATQKVIMYCGRIDKEKGVLELIQAFKKMQSKNTLLMIVGSSSYLDSKETSYLKAVKEASREIKERVIFTGYITQEELPKYYAIADFTVVPSIGNEAAGNVIIEALACGKPVVASGQGGIPEYADKSACEIINYDENYVENLSKALEKMATDKEWYEKKKKNTRPASLKYNKYDYYESMVKILDKVVKESKI